VEVYTPFGYGTRSHPRRAILRKKNQTSPLSPCRSGRRRRYSCCGQYRLNYLPQKKNPNNSQQRNLMMQAFIEVL